MIRPAEESIVEAVETCAGQLARFFPNARATRIRVQVTPVRGGQKRPCEATVVEYSDGEHAIFLSQLPIEFDDRVRVVRETNRRAAEATVTAVRYHEGKKAVAVRFLHSPCDWMTTP